ncbi:hypothetical protein K7472_09010 [Streptomyces sp. PTM05]|uniref:Lipoprotein n=1 Tax=Streptantibioticus parmotrematis TaxID=2873249 RepID=A0ABS7QP71_9ACTN|nr:hypothetical protein [Streptantibioticus parmotrematis]MBY8884983.1 hypothetical protein [Streptantibioticus parmotrematis]
MSLPLPSAGGTRALRRATLAAVLVASVAPFAAACGAGSTAQTQEVKPDSVATTVGDIEIQNAYILTEPQGSGAAAVSARVFNNSTQAQQLTSITVEGAAQPVKLAGPNGSSGPVTVPAGGSITLGGQGNPSAMLASDTGVVDGNFQTTVFSFSRSGQVTVTPGVVPADHYFSGYGPTAPASAPAASGRPSAHPSGSAGAPASGAPHTSTSPSGKPSTSTKP